MSAAFCTSCTCAGATCSLTGTGAAQPSRDELSHNGTRLDAEGLGVPSKLSTNFSTPCNFGASCTTAAAGRATVFSRTCWILEFGRFRNEVHLWNMKRLHFRNNKQLLIDLHLWNLCRLVKRLETTGFAPFQTGRTRRSNSPLRSMCGTATVFSTTCNYGVLTVLSNRDLQLFLHGLRMWYPAGPHSVLLPACSRRCTNRSLPGKVAAAPPTTKLPPLETSVRRGNNAVEGRDDSLSTDITSHRAHLFLVEPMVMCVGPVAHAAIRRIKMVTEVLHILRLTFIFLRGPHRLPVLYRPSHSVLLKFVDSLSKAT